MLYCNPKQTILCKDFLEFANEKFDIKNFNDETRFWILHYLVGFEKLLNTKAMQGANILSKYSLLDRITQNLATSFVDSIPDMKILDRVQHKVFSLASFSMKNDGTSYICINNRPYIAERVKCLVGKKRYPFGSYKYAHIVRHELSHCANADLVNIENVEMLKELVAKRDDSNFSKMVAITNIYRTQESDKCVFFNSGIATSKLDEIVLNTSLVDLDEGITELEQILIDRVLNRKISVQTDYKLDIKVAYHIAKVVGLKELLECRFLHDFNNLNNQYMNKTNINLCQIVKQLKQLNQIKYASGVRFCYACADFIDLLAKIENDAGVRGKGLLDEVEDLQMSII